MQKLFTFYPLSDHPLGQPSPLVFFPHEAVRAVRHPAPAFLAPQRRAQTAPRSFSPCFDLHPEVSLYRARQQKAHGDRREHVLIIPDPGNVAKVT